MTPAGLAVAALAVGTRFPDPTDEPLVARVSPLPSGRGLGGSLPFAAACGVDLWYFDRRSGRPAVASTFPSGQLTHVIADALPTALVDRWSDPDFPS